MTPLITLYPSPNNKDDSYRSPCGITMKRERNATTPTGLNIPEEFWVLRSAAGNYLGHNRYRHDLAEHFNLRIASKAQTQAA